MRYDRQQSPATWCWTANASRRNLNIVLVVLLSLASLESAFADQPATRANVEELIQNLDSNTLIERRRAELRLLELGPEVLVFFPPPELIESVSIREAIRRIRPQLERRAARESAVASHIALQGEYSLGELVEQIERQSRNRIALTGPAGEMKANTLKVDWDKTPFWNAVDDLCSKGHLQWRFAKDEPRILFSKITPLEPLPLKIQRIGPFRVAILNVEIRSVIGEERMRIVRFNGRLAIEPRLRPLFLSMSARDLTATANEEKLLAPWNPEAKYEFPVGDGGREVPLQWDFRLPVDLAVKSISIAGRLSCQIAAATERIVFDHKSLAVGAVRRRGGVSVRIRHVKSEAGDDDTRNYDIGITVSYDNGGPAFESHRSWMFHNAVYLETKSGPRTNFTEFETSQQTDGAIAVDYRWRNIVSPFDQYRFVYEAPTLIIDVPVEIDLSKIPIAE